MVYVNNQPLPDLRQMRSDISVALEQVVMRLLSRDSSARFPSARALSEALRTMN